MPIHSAQCRPPLKDCNPVVIWRNMLSFIAESLFGLLVALRLGLVEEIPISVLLEHYGNEEGSGEFFLHHAWSRLPYCLVHCRRLRHGHRGKRRYPWQPLLIAIRVSPILCQSR